MTARDDLIAKGLVTPTTRETQAWQQTVLGEARSQGYVLFRFVMTEHPDGFPRFVVQRFAPNGALRGEHSFTTTNLRMLIECAKRVLEIVEDRQRQRERKQEREPSPVVHHAPSGNKRTAP